MSAGVFRAVQEWFKKILCIGITRRGGVVMHTIAAVRQDHGKAGQVASIDITHELADRHIVRITNCRSDR